MRTIGGLRAAWIPALWASLMLLVPGCANVAFEHGSTRLSEQSLVFGRILLDRDGETVVVTPMSMPVVIRNIASGEEPRLITQSFEQDGRFYWTLPPGHHQLSLVLHRYAGGVVSYSFHLPEVGKAYHFGDLTVHGRKRFDSLGSANMRDVKAELTDTFVDARASLLRRNPQLNSIGVEHLVLRDMTDPQQRVSAYADALMDSTPCCNSLEQLPFRRWLPGQRSAIQINAASPVFNFPEGRSRFVALELPPGLASLNLRSVVTPSAMPGSDILYVFSPAVMLLDEQYKVIGAAQRNIFNATPASVMPPRQASLQGSVRLEEAGRRAKYLVIHTTPSLLATAAQSYRPGFVGVPGGVIPTGQLVGLSMEPAISGVLEIDAAE